MVFQHEERCFCRQQKQLEALDKENRQLRSSLEAADRMAEKLKKELVGQQGVSLQASQAKVRESKHYRPRKVTCL